MSTFGTSPEFRSQSPTEYPSGAVDFTPVFAQDQAAWVLAGTSVAVRQLRSQVERIAPHYRVALVRGERGAGKKSVARAIHALSPGAGGELVVAPAAVFAEPVAAEAARPAASAAATTLLESARGGTLYLQGVGELSSGQQAGLLRFLGAFDEHRVKTDQRRPDPRVLASSDRDLRTLAAIGQFRQDLYSRLSGVEIFVPALRERLEDIPELAASMLRRFAEQTGESLKLLAESTIERLREPLWPDNLLGLRSVVTHAAALADGPIIEPRHLLMLVERRFDRRAATPPVRPDRLDDVIEQHVLAVLTRCGGNKLRAAEMLGISRSTLYRMLDARQLRAAQVI
jgi:DNA-binding NtrC family response regulator